MINVDLPGVADIGAFVAVMKQDNDRLRRELEEAKANVAALKGVHYKGERMAEWLLAGLMLQQGVDHVSLPNGDLLDGWVSIIDSGYETRADLIRNHPETGRMIRLRVVAETERDAA